MEKNIHIERSDITSMLKVENTTHSDYVPYSKRPETYFTTIIFFILFITGITGNGILIRIFIRHRSMRTIPNTFITCLAVGDFLTMIGSVPFVSVIYIKEEWPFGLLICKISEFIRDLSVGVTVLTLTVLSIDRYLAISSCVPLHVSNYCVSMRTAKIIIALIWILAAIMASPGLYFSYILYVPLTETKSIEICHPFPKELGPYFRQTILATKLILLYVIPLLMITSFYILMAKYLLQNTPSLTANSLQSKQREKRKKVAKMILVLVLIFALCFLPNHIFLLWFYFRFPKSLNEYNLFWHILKISGYILSSANSCLNPILLICISKHFRAHFFQILSFPCLEKKQPLYRKRNYYITSGDVRLRFLFNKSSHTNSSKI